MTRAPGVPVLVTYSKGTNASHLKHNLGNQVTGATASPRP